jgi:DNA transformation protein
MSEDLQTLKNIGKTSAQWLRAVGIRDVADLRRAGAVDAFRAVKARGFGASRVLLYAIEGALLDIHWGDLSDSQKQTLDALSQRTNGDNKS